MRDGGGQKVRENSRVHCCTCWTVAMLFIPLQQQHREYEESEENLRDAKDRVQHSVEAALRNEEKIYPDVRKWLTDVDRITELATRRLRESEEEASMRSSNGACLNLKHRHQLSREAKKIVENIAQLFAKLHNNRNFEIVSYPTLPSEGMDYNNIIENMTNQEEKLQHARERVQHPVDAALRNGEEIYFDVSKWLTDVELATRKLHEIKEEAGVRSSNAACLNLEHQHQLSREAKKIMENIAELLKNGNFDRVSYPPTSQEMVTLRNMDYVTLDSRMSIMKRIMKALRDANINKIGVWGSPGVGKSTLMKEIFKKAKEESLFHEVALANVTDNPDLSRIQGEIAEMLDLELDPNKSVIVRAGRLRARLEKEKEKKILVILDDIWKQLDLEEIGITPSERCKVLLTSRDRQILASEMVTEENNFKLDILGEQEAWKLFEKMAGDSIKDDHDLQNEAIKVAKACAGLPIALVTVSRALKNHKNLRIWKDALMQLTRPTPEHDTKIWSPVYSCIELSYKHLVGGEVKSLFLLCARQDYYISYQDLLRYGFGLCLFHGIDTLEEARNRLEYLVGNLQDSCLLLQSPHSSKVFYMHDLVREVATIIASKNHNMFVMRDDGGQKAWPDVEALNRCEALSIHGGEIHKLPNKMECPKLRFFHVDCKDSLNLKIPDIFFQGLDKLEVLSLKRMRLSSLFPLTNLQTLCLKGCVLGDIHGIGELKTLVILSLADSNISNLPREIGSLTCLRLLDLSDCWGLKVIPPNVLSSLVNLEELYMQRIIVQWEVEGPGNEGKNASLAELMKLSHLTTLEIDIPNANNLPKDLFTEKLERYEICIGVQSYYGNIMREVALSRVLKLKLNLSFQLDVGIKMLMKRTEYLYLDEANSSKSVLYEVDREDFQQLKHLHIQNNGNIKHIPELRTFTILEAFVLKNMFSLEEICQGKLPLSSFKNLKVLKVENCEKLRFIFSSSIARGLSLLEELNITRCNNMGAIFVKEEEDGIEDQGDMMLFGRLQTLVLRNLPKLVGFLSTKDSFMADCRETNSEGNHDLQLPLLHHDQVSFPSLKTLCMEGLPKIKYVWSCGQEPKTVIRCLEQLQVLEIKDCGVEEIVAVERGGEAVAIRTLVFPQVTRLKFRNLPRLKWFCKGVHVSKWPMLKEMTIQGCHKVEIFASEVVSFEKAVEDQRQSEMSNIKQPLFSVDELSFPSLKKLDISSMDKLEIVWQDQVAATSFPNIPNANNLPANLFSEKLERYRICIGVQSYSRDFKREVAFSRVLKLKLNLSFQLDVGIKMLLKRSEYLYLDEENSSKSVLYEVDREDFQQLKHLHIQNNDNIKHILESGTSVVAFPILETFVLKNMISLVEIFQGNLPLESFKNLKVLKVDNCEKLIFIFSSSIARGLSLLEELNITRCNNMVAIFVKEEEDGIEDQGDMMLFGRLQTLVLRDLPKLVGFLSSKDSFMADCRETNSEGSHDLQLPLLHHDQVSFPSLQKLSMTGLPKIKYVWSCGQEPKIVFTGLEQLQVVEINDCGVEEIVAVERGGEAVAIRTLMFPQVYTLAFRNLPRLKRFCQGVYVTKWPKLKWMTIKGCDKVEIFASEVVSFEKTVQDQRQSEMSNIKQSLFSVDELSFPSLKTLQILEMDSLEIIFGKLEGQNGKEPQVLISPASGTEESGAATHFVSTGKLPLIYFKNLKVLEVENCQKLRFLFSSSIARGLSLLEKLKIKGCNNMGAIVVTEEKDGTEDGDVILFHQLQTLVLEDLPELVSFLSTKSSFMTDCGQIIAEGNHNLHMPLLHHQVSFPSLQTLRMWGLPKIKYAWSCGQEPKTVFRCLEQLQVLEIIDCGVEEIVAVEKGGEAVAIRTLVFPQVTQLKFSDLPRLKWFCQGVYVTKWPMLKKMKIERCDEVEIFASEVVSFEKTIKDQRQSEMSNIKQSLFSVDEHSFPSLETLEFWNMGSLEIIFGKLEGQNGKEPQVLISPASGTEESGATTHFASTDQVAATSFPNIQELSIDFCHKLLHVFQSNLHATTTTLMQSLTRLNITYCSSLESIFGNMEGQNGKESQVLMAPSSGTEDGIAGHIEFPILTQLLLFELPKLKWIFEGVHTNLESWPSLKHLSLWECGEQVNKMIWASKFASSSSSQENQLLTCIQQPMFVFEEGTFRNLEYFPDLEYLAFYFGGRTKCPSRFSDFLDPSSLLTGLPNLLKLYVFDRVREEYYELVVQKIRLRILRLCRLWMLTHLWKEHSTRPCKLFHNLEYLDVSRCGKLKNIVPSSVSLHNLTGLEISSCHGLINLLTSSTAKTLVQLKRMTVFDCKRIIELVAMEDIGEANVAITFNKLRYLELRGLPNFTHFCSGPYSFGFPSLDEVIVRCCPEMKTFSHGVLSTPKLTAVYDDHNRSFSKPNLYWEDDLNTTTRCLWEESNQYDTRLLFRERVENSEEDEDHPSEDEDHSETTEEW
ncbi:uncharacterized protein LOC122274265 isoform X2 [Carya illinoinensis]|uniref:uncharacterized protein LOC122274265 isoform X2 n=1 Tax=Carya illinoinensis TaxID=32201 RepID=UPI001C726E6B|nr:uncharacterized protein LOC122274265 isoform X2 [Carya illinoinensis]